MELTTASLLAVEAAQKVEAGGLTGFVLDVVRTIGELGIGLLVFVEVVIPPIPSEVVLPFSGALVADGRFTFLAVLVAATAGGVLGALLLYELARVLGHDRVARWLTRVPLVRRDDVQRGSEWFARHGTATVFTGRLVPGVRSVISIPAGAEGMSRTRFLLLTTGGTTIWNALLVGGGVLLGRQWQSVQRYTQWLDVAMVAAVAYVLVRLVWRRLRGRPDVDERPAGDREVAA